MLLLTAAACGDSFIDREPFSQYTPEDFYSNEIQITQAVNGLYPVIRGFYTGANWVLGEFQSDNTTFQYNPSDRGAEAFESLDYFLADASNGTFSGLWNNAYNGIARANFILENINTAVFEEELNRNIRRGETLFARAFYYYFLITYFGDVPKINRVYRDAEEAGELPRSPEAEIIDEIILPDLEEAIQYLPVKWDSRNLGRASKAAAQMLKARIHFYQRQYREALPLLRAIVQSGQYALENNYANVFDPKFEAGNREVIFSTQHDVASGQGAGYFINWLPNNSGTDLTGGAGSVFIGGLNGKNIPTQDMLRAYEKGDKRYAAGIGIHINTSTRDTIPYIKKFLHPPVLANGTDTNFPVFRYAETILMLCEALTETEAALSNEAIELLNTIRVRAGLELAYPGNPKDFLNVDTNEKLKVLLRRERRVELAFEGQRFQDLIRYDVLEETMVKHGEEQKKLQSFLDPLPTAYTRITEKVAIPFNEVLIYGYRQNDGW